MKFNILVFGIAKDFVGGSSLELELTEELVSVSELRKTLEDIYPELKTLNSYMISVNNNYVQDDLLIKSSDEVAIIPPVSGG